MKLFIKCFVFTIWVGTVSGQNCPNIVPPISIYTSINNSIKLQVPMYVQTVEIVTLKDGSPKDKFLLDSSVFNDPKQTMVQNYSSPGYYVVNNISNFVSQKDYFIMCVNINLVQNDTKTSCRICKLLVMLSSAQFYSCQARTFGDGTGQLEVTFMDLPVPMNLDCVVTGKSMTTPYDSSSPYYGPPPPGPYYVTPGPYYYATPGSNYYGTPGPYYYGTPSPSAPSCPSANDTFTTTKGKLFPNSIAIIPLEKLKSNYYYDAQLKFEVTWNGAPPFADWPNPLPLMTDLRLCSFSVGSICPKQ